MAGSFLRQSKPNGFTLIELMIVVAIIAILAMVAYPSYSESVSKARRDDAMAALLGLSNAMERHFTEGNTYQGAAAGGTDTGAPAIYSSEAPVDGAIKYYDLTISAATATTYTVRATPKNAQVDDGILELNSLGIRRWDMNNNGSATDAGEDKWTR